MTCVNKNQAVPQLEPLLGVGEWWREGESEDKEVADWSRAHTWHQVLEVNAGLEVPPRPGQS